jgi:hypothetical protein
MLSDFQSKTNKREAFIGDIFDTVRLSSQCVSLNFNGMYTLYFPMHSFLLIISIIGAVVVVIVW